MRFRLILEVNKQALGSILPINYQYEQSAVIYKILSYGDSEYSMWLHENGFRTEQGKNFKLFTFSRFKIAKCRNIPHTDRLQILSDSVEWQISFLPEKSTVNFIQGVFLNRTFEIGDRISQVQFTVRSIEVLPVPEFSDDMIFRTISPLCIQYINKDTKEKKYLSPDDKRTKFLLLNGLKDRYFAYYGQKLDISVDDCLLEILDVPKSRLVTICANTSAQTRVRGFLCTFRIKAPKELLQLMYDSGAGYLCSQGFGCLRVVE